MEEKIKEFRYGIHVTAKTLADGRKVYNVRVPFNGILPEYRDVMEDPSIRDVVIGAVSSTHAMTVAEILEDCSQVDIERQLQPHRREHRMPYTKQTEQELIQNFEAGDLNVSITRVAESEHGFKHCRFYATELTDKGTTVFLSNDSNLERAFHIFTAIHRAIILGRSGLIEGRE